MELVATEKDSTLSCLRQKILLAEDTGNRICALMNAKHVLCR